MTRKLVRHVTAAADFGRVAVLLGGTSSEREISLKSGNACLAALLKRGVDAHPFDPKDRPLAELVTASSTASSSRCMGRAARTARCRARWSSSACPTPAAASWARPSAWTSCAPSGSRRRWASRPPTTWCCARPPISTLHRAPRPALIVKPATQGSSVGMTKVEKADELLGAYQAAALLEPDVFAEPWITGGEYTVAVLQGEHCRRSASKRRRRSTTTRRSISATIRSSAARRACPPRRRSSSRSCAATSPPWRRGWGRADFVMDEAGKPFCWRSTRFPA